ncbi:MAG: shikimate kinase [Propionibacteriaceae bacterium]|uniref:Shikimate kinase n=1 Tax=Propionibacterium ruminifibrarum TaxID=1962131 RepID=A0A375HX70_9ACTN|nr:shikimate kinase [Propionibacterium ruminifibrarum]MBE6476540.1 shikimate kinase [Propionibacteriaceae bacterium]SPF67073.1 shikimate kinase [Propionibacterium ruminifibrarum]
MSTARPPRGRQVVLVGLPGVGKSTVGALLARKYGLDFFDADDCLEEQQGRSISEIFATDGEAGFRAIETATVIELLSRPGVIALGGGAVTNEAIRAALAGRDVVWLTQSVGQGVERIGSSTHRPLMAGSDIAGTLRRLKAGRDPLYRQVATIRIDTDRKHPGRVATELAAALGWGQDLEGED